MKNKIRILSVIIALLTLITVFSLNAGATDGATPPVDTPPVVDPPADNPPDGDTSGGDTSGGDTSGGDTSGDDTPGGDTPVVDPTTSGGDSGTITEPTTPDSGTVTPPSSGPQTGGYVTNDDGFYYYDEDTMANSIENAAGSVSDATKQYDTSDINEAALKETKWDDITLDTSKPVTDAMDFSAIKQNTENDDDGQWILYAGYALILLSVAGILYFIIATATYKKKLKNLTQRQEQFDYNRSDADYSDYPTASDYSRRTTRKRYAADGMSYAERKRLKSDTAEINLPSQYQARH